MLARVSVAWGYPTMSRRRATCRADNPLAVAPCRCFALSAERAARRAKADAWCLSAKGAKTTESGRHRTPPTRTGWCQIAGIGKYLHPTSALRLRFHNTRSANRQTDKASMRRCGPPCPPVAYSSEHRSPSWRIDAASGYRRLHNRNGFPIEKKSFASP